MRRPVVRSRGTDRRGSTSTRARNRAPSNAHESCPDAHPRCATRCHVGTTRAGGTSPSTTKDRSWGGPPPSGGGPFELLDPGRHHLGEAPSPRSAPVEPPHELTVHQHGVALGDALEGARADRGVPRRDRQGEEALARLRNGETELGDLVAGRHPALDRIGRKRAGQHDDVDGHHDPSLPRAGPYPPPPTAPARLTRCPRRPRSSKWPTASPRSTR